MEELRKKRDAQLAALRALKEKCVPCEIRGWDACV